MRLAAFGVLAVFAACGDSSITSVDATTIDSPQPDAAVCVSSCTTDQQCQFSCPVLSAGIPCCDTASSTCYQYADNACPAPLPPDAQQPMY